MIVKPRWGVAAMIALGLLAAPNPCAAQSLLTDKAPIAERLPADMAQTAAPADAPVVDAPKTEDAARPVDPRIGDQGKIWFRSEWEAYKAKFMLPEGRIVDNANGMVSHSEGQGYGMLLAVLAGDASGFETIWRWTEKNLSVGPEGLMPWKWDPQRKAVADTNNATDGDILVAWALAKAAKAFDRPDYRTSAQSIAQAIGTVLIKPSPRGPILIPGMKGFGRPDQPDGPIINPSYYVFPAFDDLKDLAPQHDWDGVRDTGKRMIEASRFGPLGLPTDWEAVGRSALKPARNFQNAFSYDAIRIPLYLAWDPNAAPRDFERFAKLWNPDAQAVTSSLNPANMAKPPIFVDGGYRLIAALASCLATGQVIPRQLFDVRDNLYYPSTLRLLVISAVQERYSQCL